MPHIEKIKKVLETLGYKENDVLLFTIRRFEKLKRESVNITANNNEELAEKFRLFAERNKLRIIDETFFSLKGNMELNNFMEFLREYDEKFNLNWCEIEFKELTIKPVYL